MLTTIINQYFDSVAGGNQRTYIVERGAIGKRFSTVEPGGNKIIFKEPGMASPELMEQKDTTGQTFVAIDKAQEMLRQAAGINKPLLGEGLGSRASASEAINTLNQALKPALEDAKYKADQMLPWMGDWILEMTRQFSDPAQQISVKYKGVERSVFPARLYGEQVVRVVAVKKLQDSILRVQIEQNFMTQFLPAFGHLMTEQGQVSLAQQIAKNSDFEEVDSWWKGGSDYDAVHVAKSENENILRFGAVDYPAPEENHEAHIKQHKGAMATYLLGVPSEEQNKEGLKNMKTHIGMHEQLKSEQPQAQAPEVGGEEGAVDEGSPRTGGEGAGDIIAGSLGGGAEAPATGRPPEAIA
jgi:hypothetical protein